MVAHCDFERVSNSRFGHDGPVAHCQRPIFDTFASGTIAAADPYWPHMDELDKTNLTRCKC
jgi:hypothetical protein